MSLRPLADRLRRLPLFDLWPGARAVPRDSDRLEWYGWVAAALVCALAVPLALVVGLLARSALAETAREQRVERVVGAPLGGLEVNLYATGAALAVQAAAVGAAAAGLWTARRRVAVRRDLEWAAGWRGVSTSWAREHGIPDKS